MKINGIYNKTIMRDNQNGYTIFNLKDGTTCSGNIPLYSKGMPLIIEGDFNDNNTFIVKNILENGSDKDALITYLCSISKDITKAIAKNIVKTIDTDIFDTINSPDVIEKWSCIKGLNEDIVISLIDAINSTSIQRELFLLVHSVGGSYSDACKIFEKFGNASLDVISKNPYKIKIISGIGFLLCDKLAYHFKFNPDNRHRTNCLIQEAFYVSQKNGNTYDYFSNIYRYINSISKSSVYNFVPSSLSVLSEIMMSNYIVRETEPTGQVRLFNKFLYQNEINIATQINRLERTSMPLLSIEKINQLISKIEKQLNITYDDDQRKVFEIFCKSGFVVLTGGPGTGKTSLIKGLLLMYKFLLSDNVISLSATTGRAAQRLSETTNDFACTMHKMLDFTPQEQIKYKYNKDNPFDADFIIADEISMADVELMSNFLNAVKNGALFLIVGDIDQLESVGAGNVLKDIIDSNKVRVFKLTKTHRQEGQSTLVENIKKINNGDINLKQDDTFQIVNVHSNEELLSELDKCYRKTKYQILSPIKGNSVGTNTINPLVQNMIFSSKKGFQYGHNTFCVRDKIIMMQNNYELDYYNGDIGEVVKINPDGITICINGENIDIPIAHMDDVCLAYAITIHKSQGSEYPGIIISLPDSNPSMLKRKLIYTAVSRAKLYTIILNQNNALYKAIINNYLTLRKTSLKERLLSFVN